MAEAPNENSAAGAPPPLRGVKVLDAATLLAGPLAAALLGDLGAEVIKVEDPKGGDPLRGYPPFVDGVSLINKVTNRNKKAVSLDLRQQGGAEIFRALASKSDVVIMNFRPERLTEWDIDYHRLRADNPSLVMLHVSAFGRSGPYSDRPGFARIAEAYTGLAHITGSPDGDPTLSGYPIVDALTGVYGAFAITSALADRSLDGQRAGRLIDLALYEPLLRVLEDVVIPVPHGMSRERVGNINQYVAPNGMYKCADGGFVVLPISTDRMFQRLAAAIGEPKLADDYPTNEKRVANRSTIDASIERYLSNRLTDEVVTEFTAAGLPAGAVLTPSELLKDPHLRARGNLIEVFDPELSQGLTMQAPIPLGMGSVQFPAREHGEDTRAVLQDELGMAEDEIQHLSALGAIATTSSHQRQGR